MLYQFCSCGLDGKAHNILGFITTLKMDVNNLMHSRAKKFRARTKSEVLFVRARVRLSGRLIFDAEREARAAHL
jgi:hypothetical protein